MNHHGWNEAHKFQGNNCTEWIKDCKERLVDMALMETNRVMMAILMEVKTCFGAKDNARFDF